MGLFSRLKSGIAAVFDKVSSVFVPDTKISSTDIFGSDRPKSSDDTSYDIERQADSGDVYDDTDDTDYDIERQADSGDVYDDEPDSEPSDDVVIYDGDEPPDEPPSDWDYDPDMFRAARDGSDADDTNDYIVVEYAIFLNDGEIIHGKINHYGTGDYDDIVDAIFGSNGDIDSGDVAEIAVQM